MQFCDISIIIYKVISYSRNQISNNLTKENTESIHL